MKSFTTSSLKEIRAALKDPKKIITKLRIEFDNLSPNRQVEITEEGFDIPREYILSMYKKAKASNADITSTFSNCRTLGNATVTVKIETKRVK